MAPNHPSETLLCEVVGGRSRPQTTAKGIRRNNGIAWNHMSTLVTSSQSVTLHLVVSKTEDVWVFDKA